MHAIVFRHAVVFQSLTSKPAGAHPIKDLPYEGTGWTATICFNINFFILDCMSKPLAVATDMKHTVRPFTMIFQWPEIVTVVQAAHHRTVIWRTVD